MENIDMGIGKLGDSKISFCRQFRFILKGNNLPDDFVKNVKFDFVNLVCLY